jgi:hypothetical protein
MTGEDGEGTLGYVLPVALVQLGDFLTDVTCIYTFWITPGMEAFFAVSVYAVGASMVTAWIAGLGLVPATADHGWTMRGPTQKIIFSLLVPVSLHTLYVGLLYTKERAAHSTHPSAEQESLVAQLRSFFVVCKLAETGIESVTLAILTLGALKIGSVNPQLLTMSLLVSLLSMAVSFYGYVAETAIERNGPLPRGARPQLLFSMLVHVCWVFAAMGESVATAELGWACWLAPALLLAAGCFSGIIINLDMRMPALALLAPLFAPCLASMDGMLLFPAPDAAPHFRSPTIRAMPTVRRAILLAAALACLVVDFVWWRALLLTLLAALDGFGSARLHLLAGLSPNPHSMPKLNFVPKGSDQSYVFARITSLQEGFMPLMLTSHAGLAVCTVHDHPVVDGIWRSLPLGIGPASHALQIKLTGDGMLTTDTGAVLRAFAGHQLHTEGNHVRLYTSTTGVHQRRSHWHNFVLNTNGTLVRFRAPLKEPSLADGRVQPLAVKRSRLPELRASCSACLSCQPSHKTPPTPLSSTHRCHSHPIAKPGSSFTVPLSVLAGYTHQNPSLGSSTRNISKPRAAARHSPSSFTSSPSPSSRWEII